VSASDAAAATAMLMRVDAAAAAAARLAALLDSAAWSHGVEGGSDDGGEGAVRAMMAAGVRAAVAVAP